MIRIDRVICCYSREQESCDQPVETPYISALEFLRLETGNDHVSQQELRNTSLGAEGGGEPGSNCDLTVSINDIYDEVSGLESSLQSIKDEVQNIKGEVQVGRDTNNTIRDKRQKQQRLQMLDDLASQLQYNLERCTSRSEGILSHAKSLGAEGGREPSSNFDLTDSAVNTQDIHGKYICVRNELQDIQYNIRTNNYDINDTLINLMRLRNATIGSIESLSSHAKSLGSLLDNSDTPQDDNNSLVSNNAMLVRSNSYQNPDDVKDIQDRLGLSSPKANSLTVELFDIRRADINEWGIYKVEYTADDVVRECEVYSTL